MRWNEILIPISMVAAQQKPVQLGHKADSQSSINAAVAAYQAVLDVDPENYQALVDLAQLHLLPGDDYVTGVDIPPYEGTYFGIEKRICQSRR